MGRVRREPHDIADGEVEAPHLGRCLRLGARQAPPEAVVQAACQLAARLPADVIVTVTQQGETARLAAKYRPAQPILAPTGDLEVTRRLALIRGVTPLLLLASADDLDAVRKAAHEHGWMDRRAVFVARDRVWTGAL